MCLNFSSDSAIKLWARKTLATVDASMFVKGTTSSQRVYLSTIVRQYVKVRDVGSGPTIPIWTCSKRAVGTGNCTVGGWMCRWILLLWHGMQALVHRFMSLSILGQTNRSFTSFCVALMPGCDNSWSILTVVCRKGAVRKGRTCLVLVVWKVKLSEL